MPLPKNFERKLFDLIENTSRNHRSGDFTLALAQALQRDLGGPLELSSTAVFQPDGTRYIRSFSSDEAAWTGLELNLSIRTWQRRLDGNLWWVQRGLRRETEGGPAWYDLLLVPVGPKQQRVLGLLTRSLAGDEGEEREAAFQVLSRLVRLFVDRHQQHQRLREILTLAREQQLSLLQSALPQVPGFEIAGLSIPAEEVGGDYFQVMPIGPTNTAIAIADAKGKGFEAAVLITGVHAALRLISETHYKVTYKMRLLNRSLVQPGEVRNLVTMFYGELDISGRIIYTNCSHPAALVVRAHEVEELTVGGVFLGLAPETEYPLGVCELRSGDLLVAYTDGWSELFNESGEEFGAERLRETVRSLHGSSPRRVIEAIQSACEAFRGAAPYHDDRTLLVARKL